MLYIQDVLKDQIKIMPPQMTQDQFIARGVSKHNNKYIYTEVVYENARSKVKIICPIHGVFEQKAANHINLGSGCRSCANDYYTTNYSGVNSNSYKGVNSNRYNRSTGGKKDIKWRNEIFKRDNYTCKRCNDNTGRNLRAHHIRPYAMFVSHRYELSNGITLCNPCHIEYHRMYKSGSNCNESTIIQFIGH